MIKKSLIRKFNFWGREANYPEMKDKENCLEQQKSYAVEICNVVLKNPGAFNKYDATIIQKGKETTEVFLGSFGNIRELLKIFWKISGS